MVVSVYRAGWWFRWTKATGTRLQGSIRTMNSIIIGWRPVATNRKMMHGTIWVTALITIFSLCADASPNWYIGHPTVWRGRRSNPPPGNLRCRIFPRALYGIHYTGALSRADDHYFNHRTDGRPPRSPDEDARRSVHASLLSLAAGGKQCGKHPTQFQPSALLGRDIIPPAREFYCLSY